MIKMMQIMFIIFSPIVYRAQVKQIIIYNDILVTSNSSNAIDFLDY